MPPSDIGGGPRTPPVMPWAALWSGGAASAEADCRSEASHTIHTLRDFAAITSCVKIGSLHIEELSTSNAQIRLPFLVTAAELTLVANLNGMATARFPRLTTVRGRLIVSVHPGASVNSMQFCQLGYVGELHIHISGRATIGHLVFAKNTPLVIGTELAVSVWHSSEGGSDGAYDHGTVGSIEITRLRSVANISIDVAAGQVGRITLNSDHLHLGREILTPLAVRNGMRVSVGPAALAGALTVSNVIMLPSLRVSAEGELGRFVLNASHQPPLNIGELGLDGAITEFVGGTIDSIDAVNVAIDLDANSTATINGLLVSAEGIRACEGLGTQQNDACVCFDHIRPVYGRDGLLHCAAAEAAVEFADCSGVEAPNHFLRPGWGLCVGPQGAVTLPTCAGGSTPVRCSYPMCTGGESLRCAAATTTAASPSTASTTVAAATAAPTASLTSSPISPMPTTSPAAYGEHTGTVPRATDGLHSSTVAADASPATLGPGAFTATFSFEGLSSTGSVVHGLLLHGHDSADIVSISPIRIDSEAGSASVDVQFARAGIHDDLVASFLAGNVSVVTCTSDDVCWPRTASGMVIDGQGYAPSPSVTRGLPTTTRVAASSPAVVWSSAQSSSPPIVTPVGTTTAAAGGNGTVASAGGKKKTPWTTKHSYLAVGLGAVLLFVIGVVVALGMTTPATRKRGHAEAMALDTFSLNINSVAQYENNTSFATNPRPPGQPEGVMGGMNSTDIDEYLSSIESPSGENYLSEDSTGPDAGELEDLEDLNFNSFMDTTGGGHNGTGGSLSDLSITAPAISSNSAVPTATAVLYDEPDVGALFAAVMTGDMLKLEELLKAGANFNIRNRSGQTALGYVCMGPQPNLDVMECLFEGGADVNQSDKEGTTPLMCVARSGHQGAFAAMMSRSALAACTDAHGMNAIMYAAINNHTEILSALVDRDATIINARDHMGRTALHWAVAARSTPAVEVLIRCDRLDPIIVDSKNESSLHVACRLGTTETVELLIGIMRPAKVRELCEMASFHGGMPAELAAANGHPGIAALLNAGMAAGRKDPAAKKRQRIFSAGPPAFQLETTSAPSSPDSSSSSGTATATGKGGRREYMRYRRKQQQSEIHVMQSVVDNLEAEHVSLTDQVMALRAEATRLKTAQSAAASMPTLPASSVAGAMANAESLDAGMLGSVWQMLEPAVAAQTDQLLTGSGSDHNALAIIKKELDLHLDARSELSEAVPFLPFGIPGGSKELADDFVGGMDAEYNC